MRRAAAAVLLLGGLAAALPASAPGANGSRISGVVVNTTCPGPCLYPPPPPPAYTGPGLTVRVKRARSGAVVATRHPDDGRFTVRVAPGRYRVHAWIAGGGCWRGSATAVRAPAGAIARVRLGVYNACIV